MVMGCVAGLLGKAAVTSVRRVAPHRSRHANNAHARPASSRESWPLAEACCPGSPARPLPGGKASPLPPWRSRRSPGIEAMLDGAGPKALPQPRGDGPDHPAPHPRSVENRARDDLRPASDPARSGRPLSCSRGRICGARIMSPRIMSHCAVSGPSASHQAPHPAR